MRKFDTKVQHLKYKVLREVARLAWKDTLLEHVMDIPKTIVPGNEPTMRCVFIKSVLFSVSELRSQWAVIRTTRT